MAISFGSGAVKPYVGGKEVQEAYVGGQLVYRAAPPIYYAFLGTENDYVLADWCTLSSVASAIVKDAGVYRIALSKTTNDNGKIFLGDAKAKFLKFTAKRVPSNGTISITYTVDGKTSSVGVAGTTTTGYNLVSYELPANATNVIISVGYPYTGIVAYFDAIRFETE